MTGTVNMAALTGFSIANIYKQFLQIGASNTGLTSGLQTVQDGNGTNSSLQLSTTSANFTGTVNISNVPVVGKSISQIVLQKVSSTGTYTPTAGMIYCVVEIVGPGGGGGGAAGVSSTSSGMGGGGGAGGYCRKVYTAAQIGATAAVVIGTGGAGGTSGANNGSSGSGSSTFTPTGTGSVLTAGAGTFGSGGLAVSTSTNATGGAGGAATNGDINIVGGNGNRGAVINGVAGWACGGDAGASFFSMPNFVNGSVLVGTAGVGVGGGGQGGYGQNANTTGGAGANGVCIITEFLSV